MEVTMSSETTPLRLQTAPVPVPGSPALDLDEIQGDVLIGLQKNFEQFIFFEIMDAKAFKFALRHRIAPRITTTRTVHQRELELQEHKKHGDHSLLHLVGLNLGFTNNGILKLVPGADLKDPSFKLGAKSQAHLMGDPFDMANPQTPPTTWLQEFLSDSIHGVFLVTGETESSVNDEAHHVLNILGSAISVVYEEMGKLRPGLERGHEHFGWLDGVSQPGIKGLTDVFPGQRLLDAGFFVFGYPQPVVPPEPQPPPPDWVRNGSFMVFRRLRQLVPEFASFILDQAAHVQGTDPNGNVLTVGMDPVLLGARLVGRWKSGAPLALTPSQDDTTLGKDPAQNNNFDFADDQAQRRCPFGAHIRKTNPREDRTPEEIAVDPHRIIRAGIPYGPEVSEGAERDRGLMFVCYQTSIPNQFEFVQTKWVNNANFVFGKTRPSPPNPPGENITVGFDPIISENTTPPAGQPPTGQPQPRTGTDEPIPNYPTGNVRSTLNLPVQGFVVPTGGGYFFVPSISALKNELSA
jgi:Dyp-type peroxidase family